MANIVLTLSGGASAETFTGTSVAHAETGVTYNFASSVTYGYFWNGDPFVVSGGADVTITSITPASGTVSPIKNGAALQPVATPQTINVFDDRVSAYQGNSTVNVDPGATGENLVIPVATYPNGASIVKAVSYDTAADRRDDSYIQRYSVLTIVPSTPPANAFRPAVMASSKGSFFTLADLDYSKLKNVQTVSGQVTLADASARDYLNGTQVSWNSDRGIIRDLVPGNNHGGYNDYELDGDVVPALMALHSDYTTAEKEPLYAKLVQLGLDFGAWNNASNLWNVDTTHQTIYPPLVATAAIALDSQDMRDALLVPRSQTDFFYVAAEHVGVESVEINSSLTPSFQTYTTADIGIADWRSADEKLDPSLYSAYRWINSDNVPITALLLDMFGSNQEARALISDDAYFDYAERCRLILAVEPTAGTGSGIHFQQPEWTAFLNSHHATYSGSTALTFVPEAPSEIVLTAGNGALAYSVGGEVFPGSSAVTRVDISYRPSTGGEVDWVTISDAGFSGVITGLTNGTRYYVRARYANSAGTGQWTYNSFSTKNTNISSWLLDNNYITQAELDANYSGSLTTWRGSQNYKDTLRSIYNDEAGFESANTRFIVQTGSPVAIGASPSYVFDVAQAAALSQGQSDTLQIASAGDYIIAVSSIGESEFTAAFDNGSVANGGAPISEVTTTPVGVSVSWFHLSATGAGTVTLSKANAGSNSFARQIFVFYAVDATATVRTSNSATVPTAGELSATLSGLTVGDRIFACVVDRSGQSNADRLWGAVWGDDLTGDGAGEKFIESEHGAAVALDTAAGATFTASVTDAEMNDATGAGQLLSVIALTTA